MRPDRPEGFEDERDMEPPLEFSQADSLKERVWSAMATANPCECEISEDMADAAIALVLEEAAIMVEECFDKDIATAIRNLGKEE